MRLTQWTDYALRVLMYVGLRGPALASIHEIATAYGISTHHLTKVVQRLGRPSPSNPGGPGRQDNPPQAELGPDHQRRLRSVRA